MSDGELKGIAAKLDLIIRLMAISFVNNKDNSGKKTNQKIQILSDLGLDKFQIARILGTTAESVRVTIGKLKKETEPKRRNTSKKGVQDESAN